MKKFRGAALPVAVCGLGLLLPAPSHSHLIDEFTIPTAGSQPRVITRTADDRIFFTESGSDKVGEITLEGVIRDVATRGILTGLDGITGDVDGNLWFTESAAGSGGHINRANTALTGFTFGGPPPPCDPDDQPRGITSGPDGNLWVVLAACNAILRFPTFSVGGGSTFAVPTASAGLVRIAPGPDGALWFTESSANKIGRITTAGVITEYPIPTAGSGPHGITAGPDGAVWFTQMSANKIGRIATDGTITEFPIPTPGSGPREITAASDGALWFTQFNANQIGRITVSGQITEFPVPTENSGPSGIVAGPGNTLWFTESSGNKIARVFLQPVAHDFNGDGNADIFWRNAASGENYLYPMSGTTILAGEGYLRTVADPDWRVAAVGDFDGDGKADILWRHALTGQNYLYFMDGSTIKPTEGFIRTVADLDWRIAGVGDFNADGRDDILWRNAVTGENYIYPMNGLSILPSEGFIRTVANIDWAVAGIGDFDLDGKADILWRNSASGENYLYLMNGTSIVAEGYLRTVADLAWRIVCVADFNGDGMADVLWRNAASGQNYLYPMNAASILPAEGYVRTVADPDWEVKACADYDGDGMADVLWRHRTTGENYLYPMEGTVILPTEGYLRTVADVNWQPR